MIRVWCGIRGHDWRWTGWGWASPPVLTKPAVVREKCRRCGKRRDRRTKIDFSSGTLRAKLIEGELY